MVRQLLQQFGGQLGDAGHGRQAHDTNLGQRQRIACVGDQTRGDEAAGQRLVVHQPDNTVPLAPGEIDAHPEVCHRTVDAQQLIAAAKLLSLGIDQQQNRLFRVLHDGLQHRSCLPQRQVHPNGRMPRRSDDGQRLAVEQDGALQEIPVLTNAVQAMVVSEQGNGQMFPVHVHVSWLMRCAAPARPAHPCRSHVPPAQRRAGPTG
ncbi:hypothetical protein Y695_03668 [Hydrogenophaga sp. T4]|nr:hypothetical protein Y695_03668 [Hydrogenophaga sp. T4]